MKTRIVQSSLQHFCIAALIGCSSLAATNVALGQEESATTWTSAAGKSIEADFVRLTDDGVILKLRSNGKQAEVAFSSLSLESHLQAIKLGKPEEFSKPLVKAFVVPAIEIPPLRDINVDSILVSPFSESQSLQDFVNVMSQEVENGNYFVFWHSLPEKMQEDLLILAAKGMEKLGTGPVLQIKTFLKDLNTVISEKEEFLFATPLLADNEEAAADLRAKWPAIKQFVGSISKEDLWKSENFEKQNLERWLASFLAAIGSNQDAFDAIMEVEMPGVPQLKLADVVKIVAEEEDKGQIQFSNPAIPLPSDEKLTVRKVNGQWVIPLLMNSLREALDNGLEKIDGVDTAGLRTGIQTAMSAVIPPVGALARAETQEDFDAVVASLEPLFRGMADSVSANIQAGMTASTQPAAGDAPRGRRGGPGSGVGGNRGSSGRRSGGPGMGVGGN